MKRRRDRTTQTPAKISGSRKQVFNMF